MDEALLDQNNFTMGKEDVPYTITKAEAKNGLLLITTDGAEDSPTYTSFNGLGLRMRCLNADGRVVSVQRYYQEF